MTNAASTRPPLEATTTIMAITNSNHGMGKG